jgi:hypothetical protein
LFWVIREVNGVQLDQTQIAIRERGIWELMDLALRVTWHYGRELLVYAAVLTIPIALFNWWALRPLVAEEYSAQTNSRYIAVMSQVIFLEAPLTALATTLFLGAVMFRQEVSLRSVLKDLWKFLPRIIVTHLIVRADLLTFVLMLLISVEVSYSTPEVWLVFLCFYAVVMRSSRPFIAEIVLLERNPIRSSDSDTITIRKRSNSLHRPNSGDLVARWIMLAIACVALTCCMAATLWFSMGVLTSHWQWRFLMIEVFIPLAMWLVVIYATVVRFLNYLDLRIRREGWEVELKVRAAASELQGKAA